ncbi:uro-adherence factor A-like [Watersipora subatra]|uniref:uro-adherence factor A-like n=1 Tax=Watersipora subatra TaxID=2589382 RepID=UPI00355AD636
MDDWSGSGIEDGRNATPKSLSRCSPDLFSEKISQFSDFDIESFCEASNHTSALGTEEDARHSGLTNAFSDGDPIASGANTDWLTSQRESSLKTQRSGSRSSARNKSSKKGPESVKWSQDFPDDHESVDHDVRASLNRDKTQAPPLPNFSFLKNGSLQSSANSPSPQKVTNLKQEKQPLVTDSRAANSESESLMSVVVDLLKPCPDSMNDETIMSVATVNTGASDATAFLPCTQKGVTREDSQSLGSIDIPLQDDCIPAVKTAADVMGPSSFNSPLLELSPSFRALADELDDPKARPSETQIRQVEEELDRIADADLPGMSGWSSFPDLPSQTAGTVQESSEIIYGTMDDSRCESQLQKKHFTTDDVINATLTESQKICTDAADVSNQEVCMQSPPPSSKPVLFTSTLKRKAARSRNVSESSSSSSESSVSTSSSEVEFLKSSDVSGLAFGSTPAKSSAQIPHEKGYDDLKASNDLTASDEDEIAGVISRKSKMAMLPDVDLTKSYCKELLGLPAFEVASGSEECSGTPGNSLSNSKKSFIRKRFRNRVIESESEDECEHVDRDTKFKSGSSKSTQVKRSRSERVQNENIPKLRTKQHRKASKNKPVKTSVKKSVESKTVEPILSAPASEQYKKISQQNQKNISREALAPKADSSKIMGLFRDISRNKACDINADLSHLLKDESTTPDREL